MNKKARIAVFVSGGGTNLQALIDAAASGVIKHGEIVLVVSSKPGVRALERAANAGINSVVVSRAGSLNRDEFENDMLAAIRAANTELIVLAGFLSVLSARFIRECGCPIINVHPSLIPAFCGDGFYGLRVHEEALKRGVKLTGATVHYVNEITDGGDIIMQKAVAVRKNDTPLTLQRRVMEQAEWKILPKACEAICAQICRKR